MAGIDFGHHHVAAAVGDMAGSVLAEARRPMDPSHEASDGLQVAKELIAAGAAMLLIQIVAELIDRDQADGEKAFSGWAGFDPEDSHAIFAPIAWLGWGPPFLFAASIGAPLFAVFTLWRFASLRRRKGKA